jgi:hypothetical protein
LACSSGLPPRRPSPVSVGPCPSPCHWSAASSRAGHLHHDHHHDANKRTTRHTSENRPHSRIIHARTARHTLPQWRPSARTPHGRPVQAGGSYKGVDSPERRDGAPGTSASSSDGRRRRPFSPSMERNGGEDTKCRPCTGESGPASVSSSILHHAKRPTTHNGRRSC